jgi:flavodoxin
LIEGDVMKIAILYSSKYGNTEHVAEFMAEKIKEGGHEVRLFKTNKTKPAELLESKPEVIVVGGPTHFGNPARALRKYIKKLGKLRKSSTIYKAAVFNCHTGDNVCEIIQEKIVDALPKIEIFEKSLPFITGGGDASYKEIALPNDWKNETNNFISAFLTFLSKNK